MHILQTTVGEEYVNLKPGKPVNHRPAYAVRIPSDRRWRV